MKLLFIGLDSWDRPVYQCGEKLIVDVDPISTRKPSLFTKYNNEFNGEPNNPIYDTDIEFIPKRETWR